MATNSGVTIVIGEKYTQIGECVLKNNSIEIKSLGYAETVQNYFNSNSEQMAESQAHIISQLHTSLKLKSKIVKVVIPDVFTYFQILEVPHLNEKELQSAIKYQADQFIPMPIDEMSLDLEILREDIKTKKNTLLIVASPKKLVAQIEKTIEYAGLIPDSLENEFSAVRRLATETIPFAKDFECYMMINLGYSGSTIYLFDKKNSLTITRTLKFGMELMMRDLKVNLNLEEAKVLELLKQIGVTQSGSVDIYKYLYPILKQLVDEVNKVIVLMKDRYNIQPSAIYLFNYNAYINQLESKIKELIGTETQSLMLESFIIKNAISQSFSSVLPAFIPLIAGSFR